MAPGIVVYTSDRLEELLDALAADLRGSPLPPLQTETIVVPGQGLARWVQQRLAEAHGIAAGLRLPFPGAFLQELVAAASPGPDLFAKDVLRWRIWRLLGEPSLAASLGPAAAYCADDPDGRKRFQLCERLAACFDDYQLYREDLLHRAAAGDPLHDHGAHGPWQAELWRTLRRDAGIADGPASAAGHRLRQLRELLADPALARRALPGRLSVFGAGTLPPAFLDLLRLAAAVVRVALYVPQPTPEYVGDLRSRRATPGGNALLARLGTETREFADRLVDLADDPRGPAVVQVELRDEHPRTAAGDPRATLLGCLQQDVAEVVDRGAAGAGPDAAPRPIDARDHSFHVHDCHSPQRELEVVRDQILAAFAEDERLEPHDVLVLVPDIDRYAPYAEAVFGPLADHLPFHVADRSPAGELPLCAALFAVLDLAHDRLHVHDVMHLLEQPAVQRRFGLFAGDLPVLRNRCERAGIRWGLDGDWRQRQFHVPDFDDNAWLPGLDRLLLGVATGPSDDLVAGVLPVADTTDGREELLARFVHFARTLFAKLAPLQRPHPLGDWADLVDGLLEALFAPGAADDETAVALVQRATASLRTLAERSGVDEPITPVVLRDWLHGALQQQTGSRGFLAGAVTVAAMLPMRTVPVQHLFLCGLDDQSFPRRDQAAPFDLIARQRRPGDRSARLDDRQMFLDALLAARQRLHLTFVGRSQRDDSPCAPSVVLDELLDLVDRAFVAPAGFPRARDFVVVRHPLQPWSPRYRTGADPRLFTFGSDPTPRQPGPPTDEPPWCPTAVATPAEPSQSELPLERLREFWSHPCRFFLQHSLELRFRSDDDRDRQTEPFQVDPLDRWHLQDEAVRRAQRGDRPPADPLALARATGRLPVGGHGAAAFAGLDDEVSAFLRTLQRSGPLGRATLRLHFDGVTISGELDGVGRDALVDARIANQKPKDLLRGWLLHVLAAVARCQGADLPERTRLVAKDKVVELAPLEPATATELLAGLLDGYRTGRAAPLPFFENSSFAYGRAWIKSQDRSDARHKARQRWAPGASDQYSNADLDDADIALCFRGQDPVAGAPFAAWAERIWIPCLQFSGPEDDA